MASQHPDHASVPYWFGSAFIPTTAESEEVYLNFSQLGIEEYKWDWEGKLVDESVIERLLSLYYDYFSKNQLGVDKFLTYRLPNPNLEHDQRLGRAFMGLLSASGLAKSLKLSHPPMYEVILPMCETAQSMIEVQEAFREISGLKHWLFGFQSSNLRHIQIIPLFEQVETIFNSDQILNEYLSLHQEKFSSLPPYLRPYLARSDPALNSGHIPTILAIKVALSKYSKFSQTKNIPLYPIIGCGYLNFRGGLTPYNVSDFLEEYSGVRTVLIQSGFRYDNPVEDVVSGIRQINSEINNYQAKIFTTAQEYSISYLIEIFKREYQKTIELLAPHINFISQFIPKRRERVQHTGLFGYSRGLGSVQLPRAIKFTAGFYSLGIPPSIIGTGRALKIASDEGFYGFLESIYSGMKKDLINDLKFTNKELLETLAKNHPAWDLILKDYKLITEILNIQEVEKNALEIEHDKITDKIFSLLQQPQISEEISKKIQELVTDAGKLRKSLG